MEHQFTSRLHMSRRQTSRILGRLDETSGKDHLEHRRHLRWAYRASDISVTVMHPGGGTSGLLVRARNLSAGGISFIHRGYLHAGTLARVVLINRDGSTLTARGKVRHCRLVEGTCHEVGIQFDGEIDPTRVLLAREPAEVGRSRSVSVNVPRLHGAVLVVEDSHIDRRQLTQHLGATGLDVTTAKSAGAAIDAVKRATTTHDLIVCGLELVKGDGLHAITRIRGAGYANPILVLTTEIGVEPVALATKAGASEVIGKPYDPSHFIDLVAEWLNQRSQGEIILSRFNDQPGMAELLADFIEETRRNVHRLAVAIEDEQLAVVRELCQRIADSGTNFGFDQLAALALEALGSIDDTGNVGSAVGSVTRLISMCMRLRSTRSVRPTR